MYTHSAEKRFVVMAGCDGRQPQRSAYTRTADELRGEAVILAAGCAKYRYDKLDLGVIPTPSGLDIPRVLDAGQCYDSYCLVRTALLHRGVWNIQLGPTLRAFLSPGVVQLLHEEFGLVGLLPASV